MFFEGMATRISGNTDVYWKSLHLSNLLNWKEPKETMSPVNLRKQDSVLTIVKYARQNIQIWDWMTEETGVWKNFLSKEGNNALF